MGARSGAPSPRTTGSSGAHHRSATHVYGAGTYDPVAGEQQRVTVTLATGIPETTVRRVNLAYLDPAAIDLAEWEADPDALVVHDAGEVLYRLGGPHLESSRGVS